MKTHLRLPRRPEHSLVLTCGSPERAEWLASTLEDSRPLEKNREYHSFLGTYRDRPILVVSHGVGSAGAAICFQEAIDCGARAIVRVGTAGTLVDEGRIGDITIVTGAVRRDGASSALIPPGFPAVPDLRLTMKMVETLTREKAAFREGIVLTSDAFYEGPLGNEYELYRRASAVAVEMECATLFVIARLRGARAAAVLITDGDPLSENREDYDPSPGTLQRSLECAAHAALETLVSTTEEP